MSKEHASSKSHWTADDEDPERCTAPWKEGDSLVERGICARTTTEGGNTWVASLKPKPVCMFF